MMSSLEVLDVGQALEFKLACRRSNMTNDDVKQLCEGNVLADVYKVLHGWAKIEVIKHIIDCDTAPYCPAGYSVKEHIPDGQFELDPKKIRLYQSKAQRNNGLIDGKSLIRELTCEPVLNANVLDYLLAHQNLIPHNWKRDSKKVTRIILFPGTLYQCNNCPDELFVRFMFWDHAGQNMWASSESTVSLKCRFNAVFYTAMRVV